MCYYLVTKTWKIHLFDGFSHPDTWGQRNFAVTHSTTSAHLFWGPSTFRGHGAEHRIGQVSLGQITTYIGEEGNYSERQKKPPFHEGAFLYTLQSPTMGGGPGRRASGSLCQPQPSLLPPHTFTHPHVTWCLHTWSPALMWRDPILRYRVS